MLTLKSTIKECQEFEFSPNNWAENKEILLQKIETYNRLNLQAIEVNEPAQYTGQISELQKIISEKEQQFSPRMNVLLPDNSVISVLIPTLSDCISASDYVKSNIERNNALSLLVKFAASMGKLYEHCHAINEKQAELRKTEIEKLEVRKIEVLNMAKTSFETKIAKISTDDSEFLTLLESDYNNKIDIIDNNFNDEINAIKSGLPMFNVEHAVIGLVMREYFKVPVTTEPAKSEPANNKKESLANQTGIAYLGDWQGKKPVTAASRYWVVVNRQGHCDCYIASDKSSAENWQTTGSPVVSETFKNMNALSNRLSNYPQVEYEVKNLHHKLVYKP